MKVNEVITTDNEILGGQPVFTGTRIPVDTLFDHLESGVSIDDFLDGFPSVSKEQAVAVLEMASKLVHSSTLV